MAAAASATTVPGGKINRAPAAFSASKSPLGITPPTTIENALEAAKIGGVDITVIRSWMGHAHLDTTNLYAEANIETKREALNRLDAEVRPGKPPRWKQSEDILGWLDSL